MDKTIVGVSIGAYVTSSDDCTLAVYGLGSCVALILFAPDAKVGGLAHVLLPGKRPDIDTTTDLPAKYGVEALAALAHELEGRGAKRGGLKAAIVGGARLFMAEAELDRGVGQRNADGMRALLAEKGIPIVHDETGGTQGRTVYFDLPESLLRVRTLRSGWQQIPLK